MKNNNAHLANLLMSSAQQSGQFQQPQIIEDYSQVFADQNARNKQADILNQRLQERQNNSELAGLNDSINILDKYKAKKNTEMATPLFQAEQAKNNAKALGILMSANTKDGKVNVGNFMNQGLIQGQGVDSLANIMKLMQADKELQNKGTIISPEAQLKADTDIKVAEIANAGKSKQDLRETLKDARETAKQTSLQYSPESANYINSTRRALINDIPGTDIFENALASVTSENNKTAIDRIKEEPFNALNYFPGYMAFNWLKNKEPTPSQIQKQMLVKQLQNKTMQ